MGLLDYDYSGENTEYYYLKNTKTNQFLKGFKAHTTLWCDDQKDAAPYNEMEALKIQRRLQTQNGTSHRVRVVLVDKT